MLFFPLANKRNDSMEMVCVTQPSLSLSTETVVRNGDRYSRVNIYIYNMYQRRREPIFIQSLTRALTLTLFWRSTGLLLHLFLYVLLAYSSELLTMRTKNSIEYGIELKLLLNGGNEQTTSQMKDIRTIESHSTKWNDSKPRFVMNKETAK